MNTGTVPLAPAPLAPAHRVPAPRAAVGAAPGTRGADLAPGAPATIPTALPGTVPGQYARPGAPPPPQTAAATPKLGRRALRREQLATLAAPRRRYSFFARLLFVSMDLFYGRRRTLAKFAVLETVARIPYQIWENAAYRLLTRRHRDTALAHRIHDRIVENREQQDNEQWHLLIVGEMVRAQQEAQGTKPGWFRFRFLPLVLALTYYHLAWLMFVVAPRASYRLNADFEDHAEHEYAQFVEEHPEFETIAHHSVSARRYGSSGSVADLLRQIGHDERMHKEESERYLEQGRLDR